MMSISRQTQNYSKSEQQSDLGGDKSQTVSAIDKDKFQGGEDVGELLNKAADPNYINPDKKPRTVGNPNLDKDAFMRLLLTQMKNQDPTNPLKSHEMSAQLAQFTSLEKLTNIDDSIKGLRKEQQPAQNYEALNLIGKAVSGDSSKILRMEATGAHPIRFQLKADAVKAEVHVKDEEGKTVRTLEFSNLKAGRNDLTWNGALDNGTNARAGEYHFDIEAKNSSGQKIWAETKFDGTIDGLTFTPTGPLLNVGKQQIRMSDVDKIVSPQKQEAPVNTGMLPNMGALLNPGAPSTSGLPGNVKSGLNQLGMSSGIMNTLKKQGAL